MIFLRHEFIDYFQCPWLPERYMRLNDMPVFSGDISGGEDDIMEAYKFAFRDYGERFTFFPVLLVSNPFNGLRLP